MSPSPVETESVSKLQCFCSRRIGCVDESVYWVRKVEIDEGSKANAEQLCLEVRLYSGRPDPDEVAMIDQI